MREKKSWDETIKFISLRLRQRKLWQLFIDFSPEIGNKIGNIYLGALRVISDIGNKDRVAQAAHSFREIMSYYMREEFKLTNGLTPNKDKIKKILTEMDSLKMPPKETIEAMARDLKDLYGYFSSIAHHEREAMPDTFLRRIYELEEIFFILLKPHFSVVQEIDNLMKKPKTRKNLQKLVLRLKNTAIYTYFFQKAGSNWLRPLEQEGFFKHPPSIIHENDSIYFPIWPESRYLARIAKQKPEEVLKITEARGGFENY